MANQIPNQSIVRTTTGTVKSGSGVLDAIFCNGTIAGGAVTVADQLATLFVIPSGFAAGAGIGIKGSPLNLAFTTKLTATFAGSGSLTFVYR